MEVMFLQIQIWHFARAILPRALAHLIHVDSRQDESVPFRIEAAPCDSKETMALQPTTTLSIHRISGNDPVSPTSFPNLNPKTSRIDAVDRM